MQHRDHTGYDLHVARSNTGTGSPVGVINASITGELYTDLATGIIYTATVTASGTTWIATSSGTGNGDMLKSSYDTNNNGVVDKAEKLNTARTITISGSATGSTTFDGSGDVTITTAIQTATQSVAGLISSTDKTKLDGIATGANNYVHPSTHPATMIVEDSTHRFVTDAEKSTWNAGGGGGGGVSPNYISVKDSPYSATGNGTTDDTTAIQSAITAAASANKVVFFPAGTYKVTSSINVTASIEGMKGQSIIKCGTNNMGDILQINANNIIVEKLIVDGNNITHRGIIFQNGLSNVTIQFNEVKNIKQYTGQTAESNGIAVYGGSTNIRILDNYVHHVDAGNDTTGIARGILCSKRSPTDADSTDIWIERNRVEEVTSSTGIPDKLDSDGIVIQNYFSGSDLDTFTGGRVGAWVKNNYCYRCQKRGIKIQAPNVIVDGNIIEMASDRLCFSGIGTTAPNVKVINNFINMPYTDSISSAIQSDGYDKNIPANFRNLEISGNHIKMNASNSNGDGIRIFQYWSNVMVSNNTIDGSRYGIRFNCGTDALVCSNNIIKTNFYSGISLQANSLATSTYPSNVSFVGNNIICPTEGITIEGGTHITASGNTGTVGWGVMIDSSVPINSFGNWGMGNESVSVDAAVTGSKTLDLSLANVFDLTLTGNVTLSFSNASYTGFKQTVTIILRQGGTARTVTYPTVAWSGGSAPTISTVNKAYIITLTTVNGGSTWYGLQQGSSY